MPREELPPESAAPSRLPKEEPPPEPAAPPAVDPAQALADTCRAELAASPPAARAARLHFELGRAEPEPKLALEHYRKAIACQSDFVPAIRAARRALLALGDVPGAVRQFDAEIELTSAPQQAARLQYAKGRALEDLAGDSRAARIAFAQGVALDDANPTLLKALQQCDMRAEEWAHVERTREQEANAVTDDRSLRAVLVADRARLCDCKLKDVESATELYETALTIDPDVLGPSGALKRLLHAQKRWLELVAVLEREYARAEEPTAKSAALFRIAEIHRERLGSNQEAIAALVRAQRVRPDDLQVLEEAVRLYEPTDDTPGLARALEQLANALQEPLQRLEVLIRIGEIFQLRHGDDEAAIPWFELARAIDPSFPPVVAALDTLYEQHERWDALMAVRLAEADACADSLRRAHAHARVAEVLEKHLGRLEEAAAQHARALSLAPELEGSFKALTRLYLGAGRHRELVELYGRAIDRARDEEVAIAYLFKIGALQEDALGAPGLAMQTYQRVLQLRPDHLGAIQAIQRSAEASMHHEVLVESLEREASLVKDRARVLALLHRAGEVLANDVRDRESAVACLRRVLKLEPRYQPALATLARLLHKMGRWKDLVQVHEQELESNSDKAAKVGLLVRMAEICRSQLGDDDRAIGYYRRATEADPSHRIALHALGRLLTERRDWPALVKTLELELTGLTDGPARARAAYRVGEVYEVHLKKLGAAAAAYGQAIDADPSHRAARDALGRVQTELGSWRELCKTLQQEAAASPNSRAAIEAHLRTGEVQRDQLNQPAEASTAFEAVLEIDGDNIAALTALEPLYRAAERWEDLAAVYSAQARVFRDRRARVAALEALARVLETKLADRDEDLRRTYGAILSADPANAPALEGLERVANRTNDRDLLADVDGRSTKTESEPAMLAVRFTRLGELLEQSSSAAALSAFRSALQHDPDNIAAIRGLARVAEARGDSLASVEAARREAHWTLDGKRAADLLVRSAMVRVQQLGDRDGAVEDAQQALHRCPEHAGAAYRLMELLLWADQIDRLIEALSAAAHAIKDNARRQAQLWQTVANLYADHQDNVGAGIAALERALSCLPNDPALLERLAGLHGRNGQWKEAASLLERVVELAKEPRQRLEPLLELARIHAENLPDAPRSLRYLKQVLALEPAHRAALAMLVDVHLMADEVEPARDAAERLAEASPDAASRAEALHRLGLLELRVGRRRQGAEALRAAIVLEGAGGGAARDYLQQLAEEEGWRPYVVALQEHIKAQEAGRIEQHNVELTYLEIAQVQQGKLRLTAEGFETLRKGLKRTGNHALLGLELAEALGRVGRHPESIAEFQRLIEADPTYGSAWRGLARTLQESGRPSEASVAAAPLVVLGIASAVEQNLAQQRRVRPGMARAGSCNPASLQAVSAANLADEALLAPMLGALAEALGKLSPTHVERLGLGSRERVPERAELAVRVAADRLAEVFGVERFELYLGPSSMGADVLVDLTVPPALIVPRHVAELTEAQIVFSLARAFAPLVRGLHPALRLGLDELQQALIVGARHALPTYGTGWYDENELGSLQKRVAKAITRKNRRALEDAAQQYVTGAEIDVAGWLPTVELSRSRVAAILAGDLPACVQVLRMREPTLANVDGADLVRRVPMAADLLRFWMTDAALEFRRFVGLL